MIYIILSFGLILRMLAITKRDFWFDEALTFHFANLPLPQLFSTVLSDNNPPFYYLVIHFILKFTNGELFLRLPSLIANLASILLLYQFLKSRFNHKTALIASGLFTFSPLSIYLSTESRFYSIAAFILIAQVTIFYSLIKNPSVKAKILFTSVSTLSLYTHYYLVLLFLPFSLIVLKKQSKISKKTLFILLLIPAILFAPWLYLSATVSHNGCWCPNTLISLPAALASNSINGVGIVTSRSFLMLPLSTVILFAITSLVIFFYFLKGVFKNLQFSALYVLPLVFLSLLGLFFPVFSPKAFSIYSPVFFALTALGLKSHKKIVPVILTLSLITISIIQLDYPFQGERLKPVVTIVENTPIYPVYHTSLLTYYSLKYYIPQTQHYLITSNPLNDITTSYIGGQKQTIPKNIQKFWVIDSVKWAPQAERNQILIEIKNQYKAESVTQINDISTSLFSK